MDPYTPRPRTGGRKKNLTLSAKEYTKVFSSNSHCSCLIATQITGTIASVRRNRQYLEDGIEEEISMKVASSRGSRGTGKLVIMFDASQTIEEPSRTR